MATQSHPDLIRTLGRHNRPATREDFNIRARCITTGASVLALVALLIALILL
ncbi:hypothetical protein [Williamsia sp.]|uniref:hypothetical protein n=1 Tax=Williamsia sp. TaxID=1872085 RepID=UPI001A2BAE24|nr:hypothetical protein [Williamsia sp.]MBJ7288504.1 hypothetical protein [Williamsia sp.]